MATAGQSLLDYVGSQTRMTPRRYKNLVPDSALHRDLERLLREGDGWASVADICDQVLRFPATDPLLAATMVEALIEDDPRFALNGDASVHWVEPGPEALWRAGRHFAVVDVETTNGAHDEQRVIEIGVCRVEGGRLVDEWTSLVNPERPIPYWVRQLTSITDADVASAPRFEELLPRLLDDVEDAILVAHHARFDVACLNVELSRLWGMRLRNPYLCTVELSRRFLPGSENYRLETLSRWLRLTHSQPHRAGSDARATAELFCRLLETPAIPWCDFLRPRAGGVPAGKIAETKPPAIA